MLILNVTGGKQTQLQVFRIAYTRPLSLIRANESRDVIESEFSDNFNEIMDLGKLSYLFIIFSFIIGRLQYQIE